MSTEELVQQELFEAATSPEPVETPAAPEPSAEPVAVDQPTDTSSATRTSEDHVPSWRLREEAESRRLAEDRARTLEQRYNQVMARWQQQQPKEQKAPDFFADPLASVQAVIEQQLQPMRQEYHRAMMQLARDSAEQRHGAEAVAQAEQIFMEARNRNMLDPMDYERVVRAPNRFDACVKWYQNVWALHTVGSDPQAWWQREFDTKMADPKFQAEIMEKIRGQAASRPAMTKLPPTLSRSTAASSNGAGTAGDLSHESIWANVMAKQ